MVANCGFTTYVDFVKMGDEWNKRRDPPFGFYVFITMVDIMAIMLYIYYETYEQSTWRIVNHVLWQLNNVRCTYHGTITLSWRCISWGMKKLYVIR
jgi:hypothetical protein